MYAGVCMHAVVDDESQWKADECLMQWTSAPINGRFLPGNTQLRGHHYCQISG